jgi:Zn-dependent peptidase ImmA (M78 family)/transcriptional regulator with XRE-family HTH domain
MIEDSLCDRDEMYLETNLKMPEVNPEMLIAAREAAGYKQSDLIEVLKVTQSTVSRYEAGLISMPPEHLELAAEFLRRPVSFFYWNEQTYGASCWYHRKKARIARQELNRIHAQVNIMRIQATRLLEYTEIESKYSFQHIDLPSCKDPAGVARKLRQLWQMPIGPVRSVTASIERAGGIVFRCEFDDVGIDGISQWPDDTPDMPPVFFVADHVPGDRQRWTLAHELGHVVIGHSHSDDPERDADAFAGEFLMPAEEIYDDLSDMTLQKAAALKSFWKVSMIAIIHRANLLGKLSDAKYESLCIELKNRYRKTEPMPIPPEEPQLLHEMLKVHKQASNQSIAELAELMGMYDEDFKATYWHNLSGLKLVG